MKSTQPSVNDQYQTVARAISFIRNHAHIQPTLKDIANEVGFSEYHLQRVFSDWAGVSPKRFLQFITKERALKGLQTSADVLNVSMDVGLSSPGRLHDLMVSCEAMSPGEIKTRGKDLTIGYGQSMTPFGNALIAWTRRGICHLEFENDSNDHTDNLTGLWPQATLMRDDDKAIQISQKIFSVNPGVTKLHLVVRGTNFQLKVWQALLKTQTAQVLSYQQLAKIIGSPKASRAVGSAVAQNKIGYLIPCHRVIRGDGETGSYRWGSERKLAVQAWESFRVTE